MTTKLAVLALLVVAAAEMNFAKAEPLVLELQHQIETKQGSGRYHANVRREEWQPGETAIILCDVWDAHHSQNAVRRIAEFGPRLNEVLTKARQQGVTIIHSPSDCMPAYADHPARKRAIAAPRAANLPAEIEHWCLRIPSEEKATYPIDQSDGGEDDEPDAKADWAKQLVAKGRNPKMPWLRESDLLAIDSERDFISDRGDEVWNVLESRGIKNVILTGVHTNMCVLGRPFGLRRMVAGGKRTVLMRDMTDTMYNPARWPYVSHFTGNDLIVTHIERFVCPTITSDQILGGRPFKFKDDRRPHLAIVMAEEGYDTGRTLPEFAVRNLGRDFRVSLIHGSDTDKHDLPGLEALDTADVLLLSVRRRVLRPEQMKIVRRYVAGGKPVIGIRTASHAFSLTGETPTGYEAWPEFDAQVFGGNYHGHPQTKSLATIRLSPGEHPLLGRVPQTPWQRSGALYLTSPLASGTTLLLEGVHEGQSPEPVAWTFKRADGGQSYYTSLGEPADFEQRVFEQLLENFVKAAAGLSLESTRLLNLLQDNMPGFRTPQHWTPLAVPGTLETSEDKTLREHRGPVWYRCVVRAPKVMPDDPITLTIPRGERAYEIWLNGHRPVVSTLDDTGVVFWMRPDWIIPQDANLIVVRQLPGPGEPGMLAAPVMKFGGREIRLAGRWQVRVDDAKEHVNMPLPAKFGTATDIVFELAH